MSGRTIAIGDIHGCSVALATLIHSIQPQPNDLVVQLGDIIDRGPNSADVVEQLIALSKQCQVVLIQGNHEELLLKALADKNEIGPWLKNGGTKTLYSYGWKPGRRTNLASVFPWEHLDFIRDAKPYLETDEAIFVHAGCEPNVALSDQSPLALRWRVLNPDKAEPHPSGKPVFVGHTAQLSGKVLDLGHLKCIDTNCHRGGWLTAMDVQSGETWQADDNGNMNE